MFIRDRTPIAVILYGVYLVFEGLSLRAASRALRILETRRGVMYPYGDGSGIRLL